jgi:transcriptional regulator with XRE-family HTH domain
LTGGLSKPVNESKGSGRAGSRYNSPNGVRDVNDFAAELCLLMTERGISGRQLAKRIPCDGALICRLRSGKQRPSARVAQRIDEVLDAGGRLAAMVLPARSRRSVLAGGGLLAGALLFGPEAAERIARPAAVDAAAVDALAGVLAGQRRAEDRLGAAAVLGAVTAQLATVDDLVARARGPVRLAVVDLAAQWSQHAAWLHMAVRDFPAAAALWRQTLELAAESGDATMTATALTRRAEMAWLSGEVGSMIGLAQAAQRDQTIAPGQLAHSAGVEARGLAIVGDAAAAERKLAETADLAARFADRPGRQRPWAYWYTADWFRCERGVTLGHLGERRRVEAVEALTAGFAGFGADVARAEWAVDYVVRRAAIHARGGDVGAAVADGLEAAPVAARTNSASLRGMLLRLHAGLAARWPDDPRVVELADALRAA